MNGMAGAALLPIAAARMMLGVNATEVKTFFEQVAADWDTMRLAYYGYAPLGTQ